MADSPVLHTVEDAEDKLRDILKQFSPPFFPNDRIAILDACRAFTDRIKSLGFATDEAERRRLKVLGTAYGADIGIKLEIDLTLDAPPPRDFETVMDIGRAAIARSIKGRAEHAEAKARAKEAEAPMLNQLAKKAARKITEAKNEANRIFAMEQELERLRSTAGTPEPLAPQSPDITVTPKPERPPRLPSTITSHVAARRMEAHISQSGIGQTEFAIKAGTTDRTLRTFRKTGKVRRDIFEGIANAMGLKREDLLKPEPTPTGK